MVEEQRCCRYDGGDGSDRGQRRAHCCIDAAMANVRCGHAFVHDGALLKEKHPGSDGGTDVRHDEEDKSAGDPAGNGAPSEEGTEHLTADRMGQDCDWDKEEIERGQPQDDALPCPIAPGEHDADIDQSAPIIATTGATPKKPRPATMAINSVTNVSRLPIDRSAIEKKSPETAEALIDQFGVAAFGGSAQPDGHFLYHIRHDEREHDERKEEADAVGRTGGRVRNHARPVVFAQHHEDAGADEQPEQRTTSGSPARLRWTWRRSWARSTSSTLTLGAAASRAKGAWASLVDMLLNVSAN